MFYSILNNLCTSKGTTITAVLKSLGISTSKGTAWKNGSVPNGEILSKLADYFEISTDTLLGRTQNSNKNFDMFTLALSQLNKNGQEIAYDYIDTLVKSGKYSPDSENDTIGIAAKGGRTATTADNTAVDAEIAKRKRRKL